MSDPKWETAADVARRRVGDASVGETEPVAGTPSAQMATSVQTCSSEPSAASIDRAETTASSGGVVVAPVRSARTCTGIEIAIVLGLSLGQSAIYSILSIWEKLTRPKPLNQQTTSMNTSATPDRELLDLCYQIAGIIFPMMPAFLVLYLLWLSHGRVGSLIGFNTKRPWFDLGWGWLITVLIGIPGIGLYLGAKALGLNTNVSPANLSTHWYTFLIYLGLAIMNGVLEEVVMIGYLFTRLRDKAWAWWAVVGFSALIRGSYHLYQGFGGFVGNAIMGVLFGLFFIKTKRVMPLVIAHILLDAIVFIGYPLALPYLPWLK